MMSKKKIILWIPQGRLGNLLFQYQAVNKLYKNSVIFTIDQGLNQMFNLKRKVTFFKVPKILESRVLTIYSYLLKSMVKHKIFSHVTPKVFNVTNDQNDEDKSISYEKGFFKNIIVFDGFFQNEIYLHDKPEINQYILQEAKNITNKYVNYKKIAIHVRFGDYENISLLGNDNLSLPIDFYTNCINKMKSNFTNCIFIVFSDDIVKAKKMFSSYKDFVFIGQTDQNFDFAAISICDSAIISASTFSWWASSYISSSDKLILAPKFWLGFKANIWFPKYIRSNFINYVDVFK